MSLSRTFEEKVYYSFTESDINLNSKLNLGLAVSGGADSVSLLVSLKEICSKYKLDGVKLKVITVNHNIRPKEETEGDALFVEDLCRKKAIPFFRYDVPSNAIAEESRKLKIGTEAAARKWRYNFFEDFIEKEKIDILCLAHNAEDFDETVLMRFFQGSSKLSGIKKQRDHFFRPLLQIHRNEIEMYLKEKGQSWRTDLTNFENNMFRNSIRNLVVPLLDKEIKGWRKAVEHLAENNEEDQSFLDSLAEKAFAELALPGPEYTISINLKGFMELADVIKRRLLYKCIFSLELKERLSWEFVEEILFKIKEKKDFSISSKEVFLQVKEGELFAKKIISSDREKGEFSSSGDFSHPCESHFFLPVKKSGEYKLGNFLINVKSADNNISLMLQNEGQNHTIVLDKLKMPFVIRSAESGDQVKMADGSYKSLARLLTDFKAQDKKFKIPVVQNITVQDQEIVLVWGSVLGVKNWIL